MLDLNKYLKKATIDPDFKEKLLQDANQAIKDEFGEELPCRLTCHKTIIFEVEPTDGLRDSEAKNVSGGEDQGNKRAPEPYDVPPINPYANIVPPPPPQFPNWCWIPPHVPIVGSNRKSQRKMTEQNT